MHKHFFINTNHSNHTLGKYLETIIAKKDMRLDICLCEHIQASRNQVEILIKKIGVRVNNKDIFKPGYKVKTGDTLVYKLIENTNPTNFDVDFDVATLYEDDDLLVINKQPFLTVHPAPSVKEPTLVDWLRSQNIVLSNISGEQREGIVHRIDKQTSGALIIAKNNDAHAKLAKQLEDKSMGRYYICIIDRPLKENMMITKSIARNPKNRLKMLASESGKSAKSAFIKLATSSNSTYELIAVKLYTGRTHQIRAHLESISRHILGDTTYGFKSKKDKIIRVMLHAYTIYFTHPSLEQKVAYTAPVFEDMQKLLNQYFDKRELDEKLSPHFIASAFNTYF